MEITIKAEPKEIAALVLEIQEQRIYSEKDLAEAVRISFLSHFLTIRDNS